MPWLRSASDSADRGTTLVELLIVLVLTGMIGLVTTALYIATQKTLRADSDHTTGLADVRVAIERLARDIRDARAVTVSSNPAFTATASQLTLWIDSNSDYIQQTGETITWHLSAAGDGHYNMIRSINGGSSKIEARSLVSQLTFTYCDPTGACTTTPSSSNIDLVKVDMTYHSSLGRTNAPAQHAVTSERLRNAV